MKTNDEQIHATRKSAKAAREEGAAQVRARRARIWMKIALATAGPCVMAATDLAIACLHR